MTAASIGRQVEAEARAGDVHQVELKVPAREPFEWRHSLAFIRGFPPAGGEQVVQGDELFKAWRVSGRTVATRVGAAPGGLRVVIASEQPVDAVLREQVVDRLTFYLSLADDLQPFVRAAQAAPPFAALAARLPGYPQGKFATPVEHIVYAILAQRAPMAVSRAAKQQLAALNPPLRAFGHELQPFPSLGELARLGEEELLARVKNTRKASYLHRTLQRLTEINEEFLRTGDYDEVEQFLLSLPGIGPWSATFVLIRGLGRMSRISFEPELLRAVASTYGSQKSEPELRALAERYAPLQGYWAHYLRAAGSEGQASNRVHAPASSGP